MHFFSDLGSERLCLLPYSGIREGALREKGDDPGHKNAQCKQKQYLWDQFEFLFPVRNPHAFISLISLESLISSDLQTDFSHAIYSMVRMSEKPVTSKISITVSLT